MTGRSTDQAIADFLGTDLAHLVSFSRGSAALYACLKALGISPGDEIIVTGYTCVVVANAVKFLGGKCVYADIDARTFGTASTTVQKAISSRTRVIIAQHTFGIPADILTIRKMAEQHGIFLIEDCALSIGSKYRGQVVGSIGDAAFWSGAWTKPIPCGRGGFLSVKDNQLLKEIHLLRDSLTGPSVYRDVFTACQIPIRRYILRSRSKMIAKTMHRRLARSGLISGSPHGKKPPPECLGLEDDRFLGKCGSAMEAMWKWQLQHYDRDILHSSRLANYYADELPGLGLDPVELLPHEEAVFSRYPVRVGNKPALLELGESASVAIGNWMTEPLHQAAAPRLQWDYVAGTCPVGERAGKEVINLPTDNGASMKEAKRVIEFLRQYAEPPPASFNDDRPMRNPS